MTLAACTAQAPSPVPGPPTAAPTVTTTTTTTTTPEPAATTAHTTTTTKRPDKLSDHCGDKDWWNKRQVGDPSDYVAACGVWPPWIDRGDTPCLPGEKKCPVAKKAPAYTGPTNGRDWSPEHGYYEGRTDGPKNSQGEPCMQGRDNNDPNC
ncbi:hypothetical protein ACPZ19_20710 [Amycolatopsis lurida]